MSWDLLWWTPIWLLALYAAKSFKILEADELGAVFRLGKPLGEVGPGLAIVPWLLCSIKIYTSRTIQLVIPGEDEVIQKYDQDNIRHGKKAPIRIPQASAETATYYDDNGQNPRSWKDLGEDEKRAILEDPLNQRVTTEIAVNVRYHLVIGKLFDFNRNVGSFDSVDNQIQSTVAVALQDQLGKVTTATAIRLSGFFSGKLKQELQELVGEIRDASGALPADSWGIVIEDSEIKPIDPSKTVNDALAARSAAIANRQSAIEEAGGAAKTIELKADAEKYKEERRGEGEASYIGSVAEALKSPDAKWARQLEAGERALIAAKVVVVPDTFGFLAGAKEVFTTLNTK
jgi:regulator of protease activity HflC (stomatin/prohibitin superfamily)